MIPIRMALVVPSHMMLVLQNMPITSCKLRAHVCYFLLRTGESDVNPLAADSKLRKELLEVGPFCFDDEDQVLYCSPNASRTQRSGVTDVDYMKRPDREYCEFRFARARLTPEVGEDTEMCRANLTARVHKCLLNCDACGAECTSSVVRSLVSAYRCSLGLPTIGLAASFHSSDVGFTIGTRWGAIRERRRPAAPEDAFQEQYRMLIQNRVDKPMAPRNCKLSTQTTTPCLCYTI